MITCFAGNKIEIYDGLNLEQELVCTDGDDSLTLKFSASKINALFIEVR